MDPDRLAEAFQRDGFDALPRGTFQHEDWSLEFFPIPKSPAARGDLTIRPLAMMGSMKPRWVDDRLALRDAVVKKASKYGDLGRPYIVAVNAVDQHLDLIDVMDALFGKETFLLKAGPDGRSREQRQPDGAWIGPGGPVNTRVTAALIGSSIMPWSVAAYSPEVYHNPWGKHPCPDAMRELPSYHAAGNEMKLRPGITFQKLAGLPEGWPTVL